MKHIILGLLVFASVVSCSHTPSNKYMGFGKESVDEKTLKKYAAKELDKETSRKIQSYMDLLAPGSGMLHPNKKSLYFSWRVTGTPQVWKTDGPLKFPTQLTGGDSRNTLVDITPDGKYLVIQRDYDGEEMPGIYLQSPLGGELRKIQHLPKVVTSYLFATKDSTYIYFRANDQVQERFDIYRYNLKQSKKELVFTAEGTWSVSDHKDDGALLLKKFLGNLEAEFYEYNPSSKTLKPIIGQGEREEYGVLFAFKADEYIVRTPKYGDFSTLYILKKGKLNPITPPDKYNITGFKMDRLKSKIIYQTFDNGYYKPRAMDARTFKTIELPKMSDFEHVFLGHLTDDGENITLIGEKFNEPNSSFTYNFKTKKLTRWTTFSIPEIDVKNFVKADFTYYPAQDGTLIPLYIYKPKKCIKSKVLCPVIVDFHGGPEGLSVSGWDPIAQLFVENGFIYAYPNVRGSRGYGKAWLASDNGAKRLDVISDIEDAARYFKKEYAVNNIPPKIGITGGSYGGYSTLIGMTYFAGSYDAGVSIVGMSNLITFLENTASHRRKLRETEYGFLNKDRDTLLKLSPITYIDKLKSPLLIIQGANDPRVPAGEAVQFKERLKSTELILFADEGHGTSKRSNRVLQIGHTLKFFINNLK